jgi:glutathione synthase/RimK-type ligase-like ATP-grasp enzyme
MRVYKLLASMSAPVLPLNFCNASRYNLGMRIALVTAIAAYALDDDLAPLAQALRKAGAQVEILAWDDDSISWKRFDAALVRSTWDYTERLTEFLNWCQRVSAQTRLLNPADVIRWNTDKHYLAELAKKKCPVVESVFIEPKKRAAQTHSFPDYAEFVVKPAVSAGSRDTQRYLATQRDAAIAHINTLLEQNRAVLIQPYLADVDTKGETALIFFNGIFSHAIRKGPLLKLDEGATHHLSAPEAITAREPSSDEFKVAHQVLNAIPFNALAYARVDLLPSDKGPMLLELELTEPSLFFEHAPSSAERFAASLCEQIKSAVFDNN